MGAEATEAQDESPEIKCLICLDLIGKNHLQLIPDLVASFVTYSKRFESDKHKQTFKEIPQDILTKGMENGFYCNRCYDQLDELNFLQHKLKTLQKNLAALGSTIEEQLVTSYCKEFTPDSLDQSEARAVKALRKQFYKVSLSASQKLEVEFKPNNIEDGSDFEAKDVGIDDEDAFDDNYVPDDDFAPSGSDDEDKPGGATSRKAVKKPERRQRKSLRETRKSVKQEHATPGPATRSSGRGKKTKLPNSSLPDHEEKLKQKTTVPLVPLDEIHLKSINPKRKSQLKRMLSKVARMHPKETSSVARNDFDCEKCCATFKKGSHLRGHIAKVHSSGDFACLDCSGTFNFARNLKLHIDLYHQKPSEENPIKRRKPAGEKNICCPACPVRFTQISHYKSHVNKKHKDEAPKMLFSCPVCPDKYYLTQELLNTHLNNKHTVFTKVKKHICETCGRAFLKRSDLENHFTTHSEVRRFVCDLCGAATKRSQELIRHQKVAHSSERPFACEECGHRCSYKWQLELHKKIHLSEKDYKCPEEGCNKMFRFSSNLRQHMMHHKGIRYVCQFCGESYSRTSYLKKHVQSVHVGKKLGAIQIEYPKLSTTQNDDGVIPEVAVPEIITGDKDQDNDGQENNVEREGEGTDYEMTEVVEEAVVYEDVDIDADTEVVGNTLSPNQPPPPPRSAIEYCTVPSEDPQTTTGYYLITE